MKTLAFHIFGQKSVQCTKFQIEADKFVKFYNSDIGPCNLHTILVVIIKLSIKLYTFIVDC